MKYACVEKHEGECFVYLSPSDVELGEDGKTVVQPDLYIHCDPSRETDGPHHGAPDFIVEVLSPASRSHDMLRKTELYQRHGVREYWIVDPQNRAVAVYDFEHERLPVSYGFDDEIPIRISDGSCSVDFRKVNKRIAHLMKKQ